MYFSAPPGLSLSGAVTVDLCCLSCFAPAASACGSSLAGSGGAGARRSPLQHPLVPGWTDTVPLLSSLGHGQSGAGAAVGAGCASAAAMDAFGAPWDAEALRNPGQTRTPTLAGAGFGEVSAAALGYPSALSCLCFPTTPSFPKGGLFPTGAPRQLLKATTSPIQSPP